MTRFTTAAAAAVLMILPVSAFAHGGDREPAGGAFMSSYATNPTTARSPAEARPLDRPAPWFVPESTGSLRALPARRRTPR